MILLGDCLHQLGTIEDESVQTCVTSPPYWGLRDYGVDGQLGLEKTPQEFVEKLIAIFREVHRVLKDDGTLWLNLGDSYCGGGNNRGNGSPISKKQASNRGATGQAAAFGVHKFRSSTIKPKDLVGIPWRVAFALQADGWYLRSDIIWHKPNCMPTSCKDRPTTAHEYLFLLTKSPRYYYDYRAILEPLSEGSAKRYQTGFKDMRSGTTKGLRKAGEIVPRGAAVPTRNLDLPVGRNKRSVWTVTTKPFKGAHFATFPPDLIEPCVLAGAPKGGVVLDPFAGAGTTGVVAKKHGREFIGIELNPEYREMALKRIEESEEPVFEEQLPLPLEGA